jgi:N6-adenosine-specific RNA methylase IME4
MDGGVGGLGFGRTICGASQRSDYCVAKSAKSIILVQIFGFCCNHCASVIQGDMNRSDPLLHSDASSDFRSIIDGKAYGTILADPPWRFQNRTGKMAPEHHRLSRYGTMSLEEICELPVSDAAADTAHLYLWVPNALLPDGLAVMKAWGFNYKSNLIWHKVRKDGGSDGRGVGFYFRNVTEILLFGVKGKNARTLKRGRTQVNLLSTRKREHSRKPDEFYDLIEECSPGPFLEMFARGGRDDWDSWGNQSSEYDIGWKTYSYNSRTSADEIVLAK